MNYCSFCGSKALNYTIPKGDHLPRYICTSCQKIHYANPNMVVGCIIEKDNGIMLCRRGIEPRKGLWNLPCGFLENEETVQQGAKREVFEETGATVHLHNLHVVYNLPHANQVYLIFKATLENDATWHTTPESTEVEFFSLKDIPWNDIAFSSNSFAIQHLIKQKAGETHEPLAIGSFFKNKIR